MFSDDIQICEALRFSGIAPYFYHMTTPDEQQTPNRAVKVYSGAQASNLLTSIGYNPDDRLLRLVTTNELIWFDSRLQTRPILALKHGREYDRTLSSHVVSTGDGTRAISSTDVHSH